VKQSISNGLGRGSWFTDEDAAETIKRVNELTKGDAAPMEQFTRSATRNRRSIECVIHEVRQDSAVARGRGRASVSRLKEAAVRDIIKVITPYLTSKPRVRNSKRAQAICDLFPFISAAVVYAAIHNPFGFSNQPSRFDPG